MIEAQGLTEAGGKICRHCGVEFFRRRRPGGQTEARVLFAKRQFCSCACHGASQRKADSTPKMTFPVGATCTVAECQKPTKSRFSPYCRNHHIAWKIYGDPTVRYGPGGNQLAGPPTKFRHACRRRHRKERASSYREEATKLHQGLDSGI